MRQFPSRHSGRSGICFRPGFRLRVLAAASILAAVAACGGGGGSSESGQGNSASLNGQPAAGTGSAEVKSVAAVSQTRDNTLVLDGNGVLWSRGSNVGGALGIASTSADVLNLASRPAGEAAPVRHAFQVIASSETHSLALTDTGELWGWGDNADGQLGLEQSMLSEPIQLASGVRSIAVASDHSLYVTEDGTLYAMGDNSYGQLGTGDTDARRSAVAIGSGFSKVATGLRFSAALKDDGSLWTWGRGERGELGNGESGRSASVLTPTQIGTGFSEVFATSERAFAIRRSNHELIGWGDNLLGQLGVGRKGDFAATPELIGAGYADIVGGAGHVIGRKTDGSLHGWGNNEFNQLAIGKATREALLPTPINGQYDFVSAGGGNSLFANRAGQLKAYGAAFPNESIDFPYDPLAGRESVSQGTGSGSGGVGSSGNSGGNSGGSTSGGSGTGSGASDALAYDQINYSYVCQPVGGVSRRGSVPVSNGPCLAQQKAYTVAVSCNEVGSDFSFNHVGKPFYQCLVSNSSGRYKDGYQKYLDYFSR